MINFISVHCIEKSIMVLFGYKKGRFSLKISVWKYLYCVNSLLIVSIYCYLEKILIPVNAI